MLRWGYSPRLDFLRDEDGYPAKQPNELTIAVVQARALVAAARARASSRSRQSSRSSSALLRDAQARNLPASDIGVLQKGKSDPYVKVQIGAKRAQSTHKKETLNPWWGEVLCLGAFDPGMSLDVEVRASCRSASSCDHYDCCYTSTAPLSDYGI